MDQAWVSGEAGVQMHDPVPLGRFPLVKSNDIDEITSALNLRGGGERRCISAPRTRGNYEFNFLRLGAVSLVSEQASETTISHQGDAAGTFYLCLNNGLRMSEGSRSFEAGPGQLMCVLPDADRVMHFGEGFRSLIVRINSMALTHAMELIGHKGDSGWSNIVSVLGERGPAARTFTRYLRDTVRLYDNTQDFVERPADDIMGKTIATSVASMLGRMLPGPPRVDGPSYAVAEAAEMVIIQRFASPLTALEIAEAIGQTLPCVKASLLRYKGLLPADYLMLVRLVAAEEYVRRSFNDPAFVAKACGFGTEKRYLAALGERERLRALLIVRRLGRGFAP